MSAASLMALLAGACAVAGAWEALAAFDGRVPARALVRVLAPLRAPRAPDRAERRRLAVVGAGTLLAAGWLVAGPLGGVAAAAGGPVLVRRGLAAHERRRRAALVAAAPAVARAIADALAGGHSIRGAVTAAGRGLPGDAAGGELRAAADALALGEPTEAVLDALRRRAASPAWETLVAAILLQRDAGGDLAGLLRDLAARLEQARRDAADARSATAQARFTAWLVAALPLGAAALAELGSPGWLASLAATPITALLLGASAALQLVAVVAIRRIARVGE